MRAFRKKFGRGWDLDVEGEEGVEQVEEGETDAESRAVTDGGKGSKREEGGSLMDLISNAAGGEQKRLGAKGKKGKM